MNQIRRIAVIDIGTVTTRLLVADVGPGSITEIERRTDITHLGENLTVSGTLSREAIERVTEVVGTYARVIASLGVQRTNAITTSASRDADNANELIDALAAYGVALRVIGGDQEARLSFAGAAWSVMGEGLLVIDVGGGSTELILGSSRTDDEGLRRADIEAMRSVDVGSRRISEMFLHGDPPAPRELEDARGYIAEALRPFFDALRTKPRTMVALAGAATTFSAIELGLAEYDAAAVHLSCLRGPQLSDSIESLAALPLAKRREVAGLHPKRAAVIVGGGLVIETALALAGLDSTLVSEHDILYGILLDTYRDLRRDAESDAQVRGV